MGEFVNIFSFKGKSAEIVREENGTYIVTFMQNGMWTHETPCSNINEATRLAENFIKNNSQFLIE